ncbi:MAG: TonB family protein [Candidatus Obscuribacterales bacterium]|nr:TonB family protein [Candidatus Obscuribacterales bacterium]
MQIKPHKAICLALSLTACQIALSIDMKAYSQTSAQKPADPKAGKIDIGPYMKAVSDKIGPLWNPPKAKGETINDKLVVRFTIEANGSISELGVKDSCGDKEIDELALKTITKAAPFGKLPAGVPKVSAQFALPCKSGVSADGVEMKPYFDDMWTRILRTWWVPKRLLFIQVPVKIELNEDGSLIAASLLKSSGDESADKLAIIGVKRAAPFAPLPKGIKAPFTVNYTLGYKGGKDQVVYWNGQKVSKGESYTTSGGVQTTLTDNTTEKDRAFHKKKEETLIKMFGLDAKLDTLAKLGNHENPEMVPILLEYSSQHRQIEEHKEAKDKLKKALEIAEKNLQSFDKSETTASVTQETKPPESKRQDNKQPEDKWLENKKRAQKTFSSALIALAQTEYSLGNLAEAEPLLKQAIAMKETELNEKDQEYKDLLNTYARLLYKQNRTKEAEEQYKKIKELS